MKNRYKEYYDDNELYFERLMDREQHPGNSVYSYPWTGLKFKMKPRTKTNYQREYLGQSQKKAPFITNDFYSIKSSSIPMAFETNYQVDTTS